MVTGLPGVGSSSTCEIPSLWEKSLPVPGGLPGLSGWKLRVRGPCLWTLLPFPRCALSASCPPPLLIRDRLGGNKEFRFRHVEFGMSFQGLRGGASLGGRAERVGPDAPAPRRKSEEKLPPTEQGPKGGGALRRGKGLRALNNRSNNEEENNSADDNNEDKLQLLPLLETYSAPGTPPSTSYTLASSSDFPPVSSHDPHKLIITIPRHTKKHTIFCADVTRKSGYNFDSLPLDGCFHVGCCHFLTSQSKGKAVSAPTK